MTHIRLAAAVLFALGLAACNTFEGLGRDVQSVGRTVEDAAD